MNERDGQDQRDEQTKEHADDLVLDYDLDASLEKVWRAISIPELREAWLPGTDLADENPVSAEPGRDVSYTIQDDEPPFLESTVTFHIRPNEDGSTRLRIIHRLVDERLAKPHPRALLLAANSNAPPLMRVA